MQKMKQHSAEFADSMPLLSITSDHRITVVGRSKEPSYEEYSALQYSSRPGSAGSFFSPPRNGKPSADIPKIPAILDAKNDHVYALQHGNSRLCCWHSLHASGPDEKTSLKVELAHPALSMSLLPMHKGVLYGTCRDGSIFIARVVSNSEGGDVISVEYIPSKQLKGSEHIGTMAELPHGQSKTTGRKRKMSDADGNSSVVFFQGFKDGGLVSLVRHEVICERFSSNGRLIIDGSLSQQVSSIDLASGLEGKMGKAKLLISSSGTAPKVAIVYTIEKSSTRPKNGNTDQVSTQYCTLVSLSTGNASHCPVALPLTTQQYGLVTETVLAVATKETIALYDLETGSVLQTTNMADVIGDSIDAWFLCTDAKFGTVGVLFPKDGKVEAAFSMATLDESHESFLSNKLRLASKVASSLVSSSRVDGPGSNVVDNLLRIGNETESSRSFVRLEESMHKALVSLEDARSKVLSSEDGTTDFIFLDTYESCVKSIVADMKNSQADTDGNVEQHNPQDALPSSEHGGLNGVKKASTHKKTPKKPINCVRSSSRAHVRADTPSSLPQAFIDGAIRIVLNLLRSGKVEDPAQARRVALARLDARLILSQILHTGKVSARLHFEGIETIQESNEEHMLISSLRSVKLSNKRGRRVFSPVDMIHDMLQKCPDVSERQMVVMLNYMLCRSLPDDIAEVFIEDKQLSVQHPYKTLTRKFFAVRNKQLGLHNKSKPSDSGEVANVSRKLILAGTAFVLYRIACYSECNEAMLRVALLDGLASHDAIIVARLLSDMVASTPKDVISQCPPSLNVVKSTCQWISALCDSFQDDLSEAKTSDGESYLNSLLRSVAVTTKQSQAIMSLKEDIRRAESEIGSKGSNVNETPIETKNFSGGEEIPGYSIDRLVF
jgi:hypothetical protein